MRKIVENCPRFIVGSLCKDSGLPGLSSVRLLSILRRKIFGTRVEIGYDCRTESLGRQRFSFFEKFERLVLFKTRWIMTTKHQLTHFIFSLDQSSRGSTV